MFLLKNVCHRFSDYAENMTFSLCLLAILSIPGVSPNAGLLDIAEYRRVSYDANIGENYLWFAPDLNIGEVTSTNIDDLERQIVEKLPDESLLNYLFLTSKGGQRFACSLPDVESLKIPDSPKSRKNPKMYEDALAASFYVNRCISVRGNHWWSYILCRGQTVEQVHGEPGQNGYARNILGLFDGSFMMPSYQESTEDRLLYIEEFYKSGTFCDLKDYREPRTTTVRYECDSQLSTNEAYISTVIEVRPCQYLMTVKVGALCHYPEFLPISLANTKGINCQPYLSRKDVRELLERQLEEKNKIMDAQKNIAFIKLQFLRTVDRYIAMTKAQRNLHLPDYLKKINSEMDFRAAHFDMLVASLELEGKPITDEKRDYMWKLFIAAEIGDYAFYSDYDTIDDENRGHLWYYFNDPTWPKNQFPKDIMTTAIQNAYIEEAQQNLNKAYIKNDRFSEGLTEFIKTGKFDLGTNVVISAMDFYEEMVYTKLKHMEHRYTWLEWLYLLFGTEREDDDAVEVILKKIMITENENKGFPMGDVSMKIIPFLLEEVWKDMIELSSNGSDSEILDTMSPKYKHIYYGTLDIAKISSEQSNNRIKGRNYKYNVSLPKNGDAFEIELTYQHLLAPLYKLLSIRYFQLQNSNHFHVSPSYVAYMASMGSMDIKFHLNLAYDMAYFARLLSFATVAKIKDFEKWRDQGRNQHVTVEYIKNAVPSGAISPLTANIVESASMNLFEDTEPEIVTEIMEYLWKKKVEIYKTTYWVKDYKMRKQSRSVQGLLKNILSMENDKDALVSIGGIGFKKEKNFEEDALKMLLELTSIESVHADSLMGSFKGSISSSEDDFMNVGDMQRILDLLEKAGLSDKTEIQIKMYDADGNEIKGAGADAVAKNIFDVAESANRFKKAEKAYSTIIAKPSGKKKHSSDT